jgi:hypothetical protein
LIKRDSAKALATVNFFVSKPTANQKIFFINSSTGIFSVGFFEPFGISPEQANNGRAKLLLKRV